MIDMFTGATFDEYKKYLLKSVLTNNQKVKKLYNLIDLEEITVESVLSDSLLSERDFVELIAARRRLGYDPTVGGGNKAAEDETDRLYAKNPWKFVEEFLQNADDCNYDSTPIIDIIVDEGNSTIEFAYNEKGFSRRDIWAIAAFSQSTKTDDIIENQEEEGIFYKEKTGRKGKGFKSVFSLNADNVIVHIRSNGYSFKLDNKIGRVMPVWEEDPARMDEKTHVIVELVNSNFSIGDIYEELCALFCVEKTEEMFAKSPFLFMHRMRNVHVIRRKGNDFKEFETSYIENKKKTRYENPISIDHSKTILAGIAHKGIFYQEQYQEGVITAKSDKNCLEIPIIRYTRMVSDSKAYRNYSIMSPVLKNGAEIMWEQGSLFRTFPMSLHGFDMPIAIDAPFELNPDRSGIQYRDEKTDTINASDWNTSVSDNVFKSDGVLEAFFLWARTIDGIRMDKYIRSQDIILFEDRNNSDGHGNDWVDRVNIGEISRKIPVFRLFADDCEFVSLNKAEIVNKDLFTWPCVDALFKCIIGEDYRERIISDMYVGSQLFRQSRIDKTGFADSINAYLDVVENELGVDSQPMYEFVNKSLYPFLMGNMLSIKKADSDAFKKMKIYFSVLHIGDEDIVVREHLNGDLKWFWDANKHTSINRYRVIDSSPVDMNGLKKVIEEYFWAKKLDIYFASNNINKTARNCKCWKDVYQLIEAAYHFGSDVSLLSFACLNNYVISENLDKEENYFRIAGVKEVIPDEDIISLSRYTESVEKMVSLLKRMGTKQSSDYFEVSGNYLQFKEDTLDLLRTEIKLQAVLKDIRETQKKSEKKINVTYGEIRNWNKRAVAFIINGNYKMITEETYATLCDQIQEEEAYWKQSDLLSRIILIRACAGASKTIKHKKERSISVDIDVVLRYRLDNCVSKIASQNRLSLIEVTPSDSFTKIADEEIQALLSILRPDNQPEAIQYYKGDLSLYGSKRQYLKDGKGAHIYLNCDETGDYKKALSECVDKSFDTEALRAIEEMERQYSSVQKDILDMFNRTGGDIGKTYDEMERRFENYNKQEIISILSWFRYSGYTNALGNGNINNEKEIEDDYRNNPWKFIYEFIQNVDDCSFGEEDPFLKIDIDSEANAITFEYNENGFTLDDVKALTKFGDSVKARSLESPVCVNGVFDREKTGRKGRGFKSVFSLPGQGVVVHVCSNGFSFKFVKRLGSIIPIWEDVENALTEGTRITVEGFDSKYLPKLTNNIEKMFGISDISSFYSICPILYLRKLHAITVNNSGNMFSIGIIPVKQEISDDIFECHHEEIVAGILKENAYRKSLWEVLHVVIARADEKTEFNSFRYTGMFSDGEKTRIASVFAPVLDSSENVSFENGALYRTLPLDDNSFGLPISINAPFETNSGRSAVADTTYADNEVIKYVFDELIKGFFMLLRSRDNVSITKYIPSQDVVIFKDYKVLKERNLYNLIRAVPVLEAYDSTGYVSCNNAAMLFDECYEWESPVYLAQCFGNTKKVLIKRKYAGLGKKCVRIIDFLNDQFVENMNKYLDGIDLDDIAMVNLLKKHIYPYIDKVYDSLSFKYKMADRQAELKNLKVFMFEMADGEWVRESALENSIWMNGVPQGYDSFGRYRNIGGSNVSSIDIESKWVRELHKVVEFKSAFTSDILKGSAVRDWEQAKLLIQTILYYDVEKKPNIPFLRECAITKEFDGSENLFRDGYQYSGDIAIIKHVIDRDDLLSIAEITGKASEKDLYDLALKLNEMGLKDADDFFEEIGKNLYKLNDSTIALLEKYCDSREHCDEVVKAIDIAFRGMKASRNNVQLHVQYEDLEKCDYLVFAKFFEFEVLSGDVQENMAYELCEEDIEDASMDYIEAYLRALSIIGEMPYEKEIVISLADIIERQLGNCIQKCKLKNVGDLHLYIESDGITDYPNAAIDQALQWLEDESKVSVIYQYYTYDLADAFPGQADNLFLFDDEKVILNDLSDENSMLEFVQKRYKGNDASFKSLVQIITEQNNLKNQWNGTKEEYISRLSKYRESTWNQRKVLFPNYDAYINEANGQSVNYVIPELLQNINDCLFAPDQTTRTLDVNINITDGTMILKYDEIGFDYSNVYSITAIGQSSKHDKSEGEKGLGFKKVFTMFSEVEIYSNGFCFKLTANKKTVPKWIASKEKQKRYLIDGKTVMVFTVEPRYQSKLNDLLKVWKSIMNGEYVGNEVSPLFLKNIDYINVTGCAKNYSRAEMMEEFLFKSVQILPLYKKWLADNNASEDNLDSIIDDLKQRRKCQAMSDEGAIDEYLDSLDFEICIPKKVKPMHERKGCFYSTLPTKIDIGVPIFMNIPLELTTGRDGKVDDSVYNAAIMEMIFNPVGEDNKSIFISLMEEFAEQNSDTFMLDYFTGDFSTFLYEIADHDKDRVEGIKDALDTARLFKAYESEEMVSLNTSYSVEKIVYQYLMTVANPENDVETWMSEHYDNVAELNLILPSKVKDGEALEKFAQEIGSTEGYFPVVSDYDDLSILYLMDEYGYVGGDDCDE